jgi:hypothetical protein
VFWASVPEASIDQHGDAGAGEEDVGAAPQTLDRSDVHAIAEPTSPERSSKRKFGTGVAPRLACHPPKCGRRRRLWLRHSSSLRGEMLQVIREVVEKPWLE